jgi:hypothetical protein
MALDLGDEEGGVSRTSVNYMELHKEDVARRATPCVSAQE